MSDCDAVLGRLRMDGDAKLRALGHLRESLFRSLQDVDHFHALAMGPRPLDAVRHDQVPVSL